MTQEEIQKSTQNKLQKIEVLLKQLQMVPSAKQRLSQEGYLENIVLFTDIEKYAVEENVAPEKLPVKDNGEDPKNDA